MRLTWSDGESLRQFNKRLLLEVLKQNGGNRWDASRRLKISIRTVRNWIRGMEGVPRFQGVYHPETIDRGYVRKSEF
ncbi:MAG: hypothetical protein HC883_02100 [Bdellovibrionaceae bacterium]|nr:hypothetical protein [Pseudobdellovibrionaceae bacterium]